MRYVLLCALGLMLSCSERTLTKAPLKGPLQAKSLDHETENEQVVPPFSFLGAYLRGPVLQHDV